MWDDAKFQAFDLETSGMLYEYALQPHRVAAGESWITAIGTAMKGSVYGKLSPTADDLRAILQNAIDEKITLVGWNVAFDIAWLCAYDLYDLAIRVQWLDGMLLWRHLDIEPEYDITDRNKKRSYGLKAAVAEFMPQHAGYEDDVEFHNPAPEALAKLLHYCKKDVVFTLALTKRFYNELLKEPERLRAAQIEAHMLPLVASAWYRGLLVDTDNLNDLTATLIKTADECLAELAPYGVTEKIVRSPKQLATLLFETWGLEPIKQTDSGADSTDKETLHELSLIDPRAKTLRTYRESLNNVTKFAQAILKSVEYNEDGKTRPQPVVFGTYSGRLTYYSKQGKGVHEKPTGFALHQMKRGKDFRNAIKAPDGYTICEFDAAGQEFRWMAIASMDATMLDLCLPGQDPHSYMGAQIAGCDYTEMIMQVCAEDKVAKENRQLGKVANLSLQYRTSANKLKSVARVQYNIPMDLDQAQIIRQTYLRSYPGVPKYWERQISICSKQMYVETFAGRRVQLRDSFNGPNGWSVASTTINYRIQGTGADQKYLALMVLKPYMVRHGILFAWELHDGIYLLIPDVKVSQCVPEIQAMLANLPYQKAWGFTPPIPLPWDAKTGKRWGDLKNWEG